MNDLVLNEYKNIENRSDFFVPKKKCNSPSKKKNRSNLENDENNINILNISSNKELKNVKNTSKISPLVHTICDLTEKFLHEVSTTGNRMSIVSKKKSPLTVVELTREHIPHLERLEKIVSLWRDFIFDSDKNFENSERLQNVHTICTYSAQYLHNICMKATEQRVFFAMSLDQRIEGVAIINQPNKKKTIEMQYLLANPLYMNDTISRGAGTALMKRAGYLAQEQKKSITLKSTPLAESFYVYLGFVQKGNAMTLLAENIHQLLNK